MVGTEVAGTEHEEKETDPRVREKEARQPVPVLTCGPSGLGRGVGPALGARLCRPLQGPL